MAGPPSLTWTTRTSCGSTWTLNREPHSATPSASPAVARELLEELGLRGYPKTSGNRGIHIYLRIQPKWTFEEAPPRGDRVRPRAGAPRPGRDHQLVEGGARRPHLPGLQPEQSRSNDRERVEPETAARGAGQHADDLGSGWRRSRNPADFNLKTVPEYLADGNPWAGMDDVAHPLDPLLDLWESLPGWGAELPARLPQDAGRAAPRAAIAKGRRKLAVT